MKRSWRDSEQFWRCSCVYVLIETSLALQCVCVQKENARLISCIIISACEQSIVGSRSVKEISCTTACHSTAALLQTGTSASILTLHRHFLSAHYLSGLFRWAWAVTEQIDRAEYWTKRHAAQWWRLREFSLQNVCRQRGISQGYPLCRCNGNLLAARGSVSVACWRIRILIGLICSTIGRCDS